MNEAFQASNSITDLTEEEFGAVFGAEAGDSYVCRVENGQIVVGSCKKVD